MLFLCFVWIFGLVVFFGFEFNWEVNFVVVLILCVLVFRFRLILGLSFGKYNGSVFLFLVFGIFRSLFFFFFEFRVVWFLFNFFIEIFFLNFDCMRLYWVNVLGRFKLLWYVWCVLFIFIVNNYFFLNLDLFN